MHKNLVKLYTKEIIDYFFTHQVVPVLFAGLGGLIAQRLEEQLFRWLRAAELTCDRAALLVAQDPKVQKVTTKCL